MCLYWVWMDTPETHLQGVFKLEWGGLRNPERMLNHSHLPASYH